MRNEVVMRFYKTFSELDEKQKEKARGKARERDNQFEWDSWYEEKEDFLGKIMGCSKKEPIRDNRMFYGDSYNYITMTCHINALEFLEKLVEMSKYETVDDYETFASKEYKLWYSASPLNEEFEWLWEWSRRTNDIRKYKRFLYWSHCWGASYYHDFDPDFEPMFDDDSEKDYTNVICLCQEINALIDSVKDEIRWCLRKSAEDLGSYLYSDEYIDEELIANEYEEITNTVDITDEFNEVVRQRDLYRSLYNYQYKLFGDRDEKNS